MWWMLVCKEVRAIAGYQRFILLSMGSDADADTVGEEHSSLPLGARVSNYTASHQSSRSGR